MAKKTRAREQPPKQTAPERPPATVQMWRALADSPGVRWTAFAVVVLLILAARFVHLGADPPTDVSWSHALFTDPPQYTSYARNAVVFGEWNPIGDDRLIFFQKNITGIVTYIVFAILGPDVSSGQLVAILLNLLALAFAIGIAHRSYGFYAGVGTGLFLSLNYLFVSYSRMPFLEVASNASLVAGLYFLLSSRKIWWMAILAGLVAGLGTFFGKVTALHAAPMFLLTAILIGWQAESDSKGRRWARPIGYAAGLLVIYGAWYVYAYMPASQQVLDYLQEQSLSLYGTPVGLTSLSGFINQWFSFSINNRLLTWGPVFSVLGILGMVGLVVRNLPHWSFRDVLKQMDPTALAVVGWFWSAWAAFMPFNYRPVRYQIVLLIPLAIAAGWLVSTALVGTYTRPRKERPRSVSWWAILPLAVIFATTLQVMVMPHVLNMNRADALSRGITLASLFGIVLAAILVVIKRKETGGSLVSAPTRSALSWAVVALLVVFLVNQGRHFVRWWSNPQYSIEYANRDLKRILSHEAVLTGGYGTPLAQSDSMKTFPAMFGVSEVDRDFFATFPVTHVAEVDDQNQPFNKNYPGIAGRAPRVTTYTIRNLPVKIVRVAEFGGNPQAEQYPLSAYEDMRRRTADLTLDSLLTFLPAWIADSGNHFSGWRWLGDAYSRANRLEDALDAYEHAAAFFPDDFFLWAQIGDISWEYYRTGGATEYGDRAIESWSRALELNPRNPQLLARLSSAGGS
ncbi:MAG: hypothetical protein GF341_05710 [candidate division Zixibacteria bacterium]|nr:hypothetical protein [candidate division Zixibacteria bacterium]